MGSRPKRRMPIAERAKIFAPFAALKGLNEALSEKEKIREEKKELSEEMAEELNAALISIVLGEVITIVFYDNCERQYVQLTGCVERIDKFNRIIEIGNTKISFDDLFKINRL